VTKATDYVNDKRERCTFPSPDCVQTVNNYDMNFFYLMLFDELVVRCIRDDIPIRSVLYFITTIQDREDEQSVW